MLLMPGSATLICSAMATMAAATISTSTQASRKPPDSKMTARGSGKIIWPMTNRIRM
jgi:hypothetical protein